MTTVADVFSRKPRALHTIGFDETLHVAAMRMAERGIGSLVVLDGERIVGFLTERDIVLRMAAASGAVYHTPVAHAVSPVEEVDLDDDLDRCMALMTDRRTRHLLAMDGDAPVGVISIGDVVKEAMADREDTITILAHYITGAPAA